MAWPRGSREAGLALIVAVAALLALNFSRLPLLRSLETASFDLRFQLRGVRPPGGEVVIVMVDDRSIAALGHWPFNRRLFAKAVRLLDAAEAKEIVFDLLFTEPDQPVPAEARAAAGAAVGLLPPDADPAVRAALRRLAEDDPDAELAAAIRASGRVFLPIAFTFVGGEEAAPPALEQHFYKRLDPSPVAPLFPLQPVAAVMPLAPLVKAAAGLGHVTIAYDTDGAPRYDYPALPYDGEFMPSLSVRAAAAYLDIPWDRVGLALGAGIAFGSEHMPTDTAGRIVVNYRGPRGTIPTYSFVDLIQGKVPATDVRGRIVLIGASVIGNADTSPAPFGNTPMPGTERMADIIDSIVQRDFIRDNPPPWPLIEIGLVAFLALASGAAAGWLPTGFSPLAGAAPLVLWAVLVQIAFVRGLWLPAVNPGFALLAAALSVLLYRYAFVDRLERQVQEAFRHYLAPDIVNALAAHPEQLHLGGQTRELTVMFSDIRGFTAISETFKANPQGLTRLINRGFLTPMTKVIMSHRGTIDKYMGDCVMAFWNAPIGDPRHADHACETALAMLGELDGINRRLAAEAEEEGREFHRIAIGIGINTGECVVGNMGSDERFAYTAMGDAVNLASRLEGQTKTYHVSIVIGEDTRAAAPSWAALELDRIAVKGKEQAVRVYTLLGDPAFAASPEFAALAAAHEAMLTAYRRQDWRAAEAALARCRGRDPRIEGLYDLYAERIAFYTANPPGPDWDGVFVAETK